MENSENKQGFASLNAENIETSIVEQDNKTNTSRTFPNELSDYLKNISSDVYRSTNPKLRREHQRLTDLLSSYRRLTERLEKQIAQSSNNNERQSTNACIVDNQSTKNHTSSPKVVEAVFPEIYSVLRPDLYKDVREEEKKRFITKFAKKRFYTDIEKVLPPHTSPRTHVLQDRRQYEKDRFCRLVSSAHSGLFSPFGNCSYPFKKNLRTHKPVVPTIKVDDVREKEKDRLAKIFACSALRDSNCTQKSNHSTKINEDKDHTQNEWLKLLGDKFVEEADMCKAKLGLNQENINPQISCNSKNMVRVGEYSPLNGHQRGKTMLGVGEHEEQQRHLIEERRREYRSLMAAQREEMEMAYRNENSQIQSKPRMSSASTQTDSEDSSTSFQDNQQSDFDSPVQSATSSPRRRRPTEFSPREKLLSDLYGRPPINNFQTALNVKEKQAAYAEALRAQIEEKRRLEEERKRREKEEEELIEKRVREQAERLRNEYLKEQNKKYDWMQQRKAQEEILRRRLAELEVESLELKKQERQKKFQVMNEVEQSRQKPSKKVLQNRSAYSVQNPVNSNLPVDSAVKLSVARSPFSKSPILEVVPLLECDKQNILSQKSGELRRGYTGFNENIGAYSLGPGINLLSPQYLSSEELSSGATEKKSFSKSVNREENLPHEGYVPSVGRVSPRSVNTQQSKRSPVDRYDDGHSSPLNGRFSPPGLPEANQQEINRPSSPVIPALQTDMLLKRNSKILDDKRKVPSSQTTELERTAITEPLKKRESTPSRNILTQLGEFRRKLAVEHHLMEQRLKQSNS